MHFSIYPPIKDKVLGTQSIFRCLLSATSFPGTIVSVGEVVPWGKLCAAGTAIIQTLCDANTSIYFSPSFNDSTIVKSTSFHTAANILPQQASQFVFASTEDTLLFSDLEHGDEYKPECAATVVIQIANWDGGETLTLRGPGIEHSRQIAPPLPKWLLTYLCTTDKPDYPCGVDFILINSSELMAIPRTTKVIMEKN